MYFRLIVDGIEKDVLIKAPNSVVASDIASSGLGGSFEKMYSIEHIEKSDITYEMAKTYQLWGVARYEEDI